MRARFTSPCKATSANTTGWNVSSLRGPTHFAVHGSSRLPVSTVMRASALSPASPSTRARTTYSVRGFGANASVMPPAGI